MNIEQARFNMIEQQIRPWDVLNTDILDLLYEVRREDFVPSNWKPLAFVDMEIPLEFEENMLSPKLEARLIQELKVHPSHKTLQIGTGSGYVAALLSRLSAHVTTVEIHSGLAQQAEKKYFELSLNNITVEVGNGATGWPGAGQWNSILITGSLPVFPQSYLDILAPGGNLVAIIGDAPVMTVQRWRKDRQGIIEMDQLFETVVKPLRHATQPVRFEF